MDKQNNLGNRKKSYRKYIVTLNSKFDTGKLKGETDISN